ncbi:hypothetical protein IC615_17665 [Serratia ureilytica]
MQTVGATQQIALRLRHVLRLDNDGETSGRDAVQHALTEKHLFQEMADIPSSNSTVDRPKERAIS